MLLIDRNEVDDKEAVGEERVLVHVRDERPIAERLTMEAPVPVDVAEERTFGDAG